MFSCLVWLMCNKTEVILRTWRWLDEQITCLDDQKSFEYVCEKRSTRTAEILHLYHSISYH